MIYKYNKVFHAPDDTVLGSDPGVAPLTRDDNFWAMMADDPNAVSMSERTKIEYYMTKIAKRLDALETGVAAIPVPNKTTDVGKVIKVNSDGEYELGTVTNSNQ